VFSISLLCLLAGLLFRSCGAFNPNKVLNWSCYQIAPTIRLAFTTPRTTSRIYWTRPWSDRLAGCPCPDAGGPNVTVILLRQIVSHSAELQQRTRAFHLAAKLNHVRSALAYIHNHDCDKWFYCSASHFKTSSGVLISMPSNATCVTPILQPFFSHRNCSKPSASSSLQRSKPL
jgi:hypothetical protein